MEYYIYERNQNNNTKLAGGYCYLEYRFRIVEILCIIKKKSQIKTDRRNSINDHSDDAKTHVSCFQSNF